MTMRSVQDRFWSDGWVRRLNPLDRYLFLYLITNEHTNWAGIYELDIGMMAFESGIDREELERSMLPRLSPKAIYVDGWVYIPNWLKHHLNERGKLTPDQEIGVQKAWEKVPVQIRNYVEVIEKGGGVPPPIPHRSVPSSFALSSSLSFASASVQEVHEDEPRVKKTRGNLTGFPAFWELYPRKADKMSAAAVWRALKPEERLLAAKDIRTRAKSKDWTKENGKYIPLAKNYLEGKRWEDEGVVLTKETDDKYAKYD